MMGPFTLGGKVVAFYWRFTAVKSGVYYCRSESSGFYRWGKSGGLLSINIFGRLLRLLAL